MQNHYYLIYKNKLNQINIDKLELGRSGKNFMDEGSNNKVPLLTTRTGEQEENIYIYSKQQ